MKKRLIILMLLAFGLGFGMNAMAQKGSCNKAGQGRGQGNKSCVYGKQAGFADADKDGVCDNRKDKKGTGYGKGDGTCKASGTTRGQGNPKGQGKRDRNDITPAEKK